MKLFKIVVDHYAPKSSHRSIEKFAIANSDLQILHVLNSDDFTYGGWMDKHNEDGPIEIYDEEFDVIGQEYYLDRMLRLRGECHDDGASVEDAYYGVTHYGWEEGKEITEAECETLLRLGVAEDWRDKPEMVIPVPKNQTARS